MPTYQYACTSCGEQLEVVQKFTDDPLTVCPSCEGALRKVFSAVGVVFKGSGFYKTDSRAPAKKSTAGSTSTPSEGGSGSDKPAPKTESAGDRGTASKPATGDSGSSGSSGSSGTSGSSGSSGDRVA